MTPEEKRRAWDFASGLSKVDGLETSPEFKEMVEAEIRGEITTEDMLKRLNEKYRHGPMNDDTYWAMYERAVSGEVIDKDDYKKLVEWLCERHAVDEIMDLIWHEKYRDK